MIENIEWADFSGSCKKFLLEKREEENRFTTFLMESDFEPNRNIDAIFYDHLKERNSSIVEVLYSGGMDSELVLLSCIKNKIPVEAITMRIILKGIVHNAAELYYAEKFCRENSIKQHFFDLDGVDFFNSGEHYHYLNPLNIREPHVASHLWLIDKCTSFPVIGGDWPWVQLHTPDRRLSPFKMAYNSYYRYMKHKGIDGISNMISHSYESSYYFMKKQIEVQLENENTYHSVVFLKQKMYQTVPVRTKMYGWDRCPKEIFDLTPVRENLYKQEKELVETIVWGEKTKELIKSSVYENSSFC